MTPLAIIPLYPLLIALGAVAYRLRGSRWPWPATFSRVLYGLFVAASVVAVQAAIGRSIDWRLVACVCIQVVVGLQLLPHGVVLDLRTPVLGAPADGFVPSFCKLPQRFQYGSAVGIARLALIAASFGATRHLPPIVCSAMVVGALMPVVYWVCQRSFPPDRDTAWAEVMWGGIVQAWLLGAVVLVGS